MLPLLSPAPHSAKFSKLSSDKFDKAYMKEMVKDHEKDVKEFQKAADKSDDADLKAWAGKTLPTLQTHLDKAKEIDKNLSSDKKEENKEAK